MGEPAAQLSADVVVVGGGPVGAYLAGRLAAAGLDVLVLERSARGRVRAEVGYVHFDVRHWAELGLERPAAGDPVLAWHFEQMRQVPLAEARAFSVPYAVDVLDLCAFVERLERAAEATGRARFLHEAVFDEPLVEGPRVAGVRLADGRTARARVVADCTGRRAEVRDALPSETGVDLLRERPLRRFTVHMEQWRCSGEFPRGSSTYVAFRGFANQVSPDRLLVGCSSLGGPESALDCLSRMVEAHLHGIRHEIEHVYGSEVPYDFPPADLVGHGFVSAGDAAFQNKPFNGEGIASGMQAARLAADAVVAALKDGEATPERLWSYPLAWFRGTGADFARVRGAGEALLDLEPVDFDWLFRAGLVGADDLGSLWATYRVRKGPLDALRALSHAPGNPRLFLRVARGLRAGARLAACCRAYPARPAGLRAWAKRYEKLLLRAP